MVIIEPIQGESGVVVPPPGYLTAAREITSSHGTLLVLDEVQTGIGRTGYWFAHQAEGVAPDVVTLAKGLGGGLPLGAVIAFDRTADALVPGTHASTFGGNPICCAAALATLDLVEGGYMRNADDVGRYFRRRLRELMERHAFIGEVRGKGMMIGMELVTDRETKAPAKELCNAVVTRAFHNGLLLLSCGTSTVRFMPPLLATREHADEAVALVEASLGGGRV
jgi:4-aminobutyrate aminotransferase